MSPVASVDVSCVVPVRDQQRYLPAALESVFGQSVAPREIIVVDDGSSDGTSAVLGSYAGSIIAASQDKQGAGAARNHGVRLASSRYVAFLDADDLWHPRKLERQMERLEADPDLQLVTAFYRNFWTADLCASSRPSTPLARFTHSDAPRGDSIITWVLRREVFVASGGFRTDLLIGEDTEWLDRFRRSGGRMETMHQVLARRRLHDANLTLRFPEAHVTSIVSRVRDRIHRSHKP